MGGARAFGWLTPSEIAYRLGCDEARVVDLARTHHWPRVQGSGGTRIGVELAAVRRALGGRTVSGQASLAAR